MIEKPPKWKKDRGPDTPCGRCPIPITIGDDFCFERVADGGLLMIHFDCLETDMNADTADKNSEDEGKHIQ